MSTLQSKGDRGGREPIINLQGIPFMFTSGWRVDGWVEAWMDRLSQPSKENRAERPEPSRRRDDGSQPSTNQRVRRQESFWP